MAKEHVVQLFRAVRSNPELLEELNAAPDLEALVSMAGRRGYSFTIDEWKQTTGFVVEELKCEMSEIPGI